MRQRGGPFTFNYFRRYRSRWECSGGVARTAKAVQDKKAHHAARGCGLDEIGKRLDSISQDGFSSTK